MLRVYVRFLMAIFLLAFVFMAINPSNYLSFLFFISIGFLLSASMLIYGIHAYKEGRYIGLFRPIIKAGIESKKPSISIAVFAIALSAFSYNIYFKGVLHFRMQELLLEAKELQKISEKPKTK